MSTVKSKTKVTKKKPSVSDVELRRQCMKNAHDIGYKRLNVFQIDIYNEMMARVNQGFGLHVPMGTGKTFLGLLTGLKKAEQTIDCNPIVFIASKTLIDSAISEIQKFFGDSVKYQVMKTGSDLKTWTLYKSTHVILVVNTMVAKAYKDFELKERFEESVNRNHFVVYTHYREITEPLLPQQTKGVGLLMSKVWGCVIVDEAQTYNNITTQVCGGICCIVSPNRILMSGTMFDEPKPERYLGYYCMINWPKIQRNLPDMKTLMYQVKGAQPSNYAGVMETFVYREKNTEFIVPSINKHIITHELTQDEQCVYKVLRDVIVDTHTQLETLQHEIQHARWHNQLELERLQLHARNLRAGLLSMTTYLRQYLTCPILPVATIVLNMADIGGTERDHISRMLNDAFQRQNLQKYLQNEKSAVSSRMKAVYKKLDEHRNEKVFIVTSFRTTVDLFIHYMPDKTRQIFTIEAKHNETRRGQIIEDFRNSDCGVLICTTSIGSNGLNLQCASTIMIMDFWWNAGKTNQSISRIVRMGQLAKTVNIFLFTSNTGIERGLFKKQVDKLNIAEDLMKGQTTKAVTKISTKEMIKFLLDGENEELLKLAYYR